MTIFHHKLLTTKVGFWPMDELIHQSMVVFVNLYKKCHPKFYRSDIKYHMTLNFMFNVAYIQLTYRKHATNNAHLTFMFYFLRWVPHFPILIFE